VSAGPRGVYDFGRVDENPVDRQVRMARATTEALNALGFFLCSSATRMLGADELDRALQHAARDHLPFLLRAIPRRADLEARPNLARRILAGLEGDRRTITGIAERGLDRGSPDEAALWQAVRNILVAAGVSLPTQAEGPCQLHGATCPVPQEG